MREGTRVDMRNFQDNDFYKDVENGKNGSPQQRVGKDCPGHEILEKNEN